MGGKVLACGNLEFVAAKGVVTVVDARVDHYLGALVDCKEWIVDFPLGMGGAAENIAAVNGGIASGSADWVKPGFLDQQDVVSVVRS